MGNSSEQERSPIASHDLRPNPLANNSHSDALSGVAPHEAPAIESRAAKTIWEVFQSGRPLTYIHSVEEQRVGRVLREMALSLFAPPVPVWTWSLTEGLRRDGEAAEAGTQDPRKALDFIAAYDGAAIFHLKDFHEPLRESAEIRRRLRDVYGSCLDRRKFVVISALRSGSFLRRLRRA